MLPEEFIKQVRGVNEGKDLSKEFVLECYQNIQTNEIKECRNYHISSECTRLIWKYILKNSNLCNRVDYIEEGLK